MRPLPGLAALLCLMACAVSPLQAQQSPGETAPAPPDPGMHPPHAHEYEHPQDAGQLGASGHVAPEPPAHALPPMSSSGAMAQMMGMNDAAATGQVLIDQLEWVHSSYDDSVAWQAQGWYGTDYDKLWIKTEGEHGGDAPSEARAEVLWDRIVTRWWSLQAGARLDVDSLSRLGTTPTRAWAALGLQGIAPGWLDAEATVYLSDGGHAAARFRSTYDLLLTQRLILQPEIEANLESRADPARLVGGGLTELAAGIRLRYEIRREIAPYLGLAGTWHVGATAGRVRAAGYATDERGLVLGIRAWF